VVFVIKEVTVTVEAADENNQKLHDELIRKELKKNHINEKSFEKIFVKKSIDARHGQLKLHLRYKVYIGESPAENEGKLPQWKKIQTDMAEHTCHRVIIVGSGPAGLFGALKLLENGIKPVIIERGTETALRKKDIAQISRKAFVNSDSNYCFGEGGAGTFSDGKLYTRSNKRGDIGGILRIFNFFGADNKILTDAHPHIGTDRLPQVINAMRRKIIELGGEFYFNHRVTDLVTEGKSSGQNTKRSEKRVCGVQAQNLLTGEKKTFTADAVMLATGHSASDIYEMLAGIAPDALEAKTFAAGVRVEHPRELIDKIQYHGSKMAGSLGAAEYRVTVQVDGRGVYSFCMCPGGFVVPSSSGPGEIVVNGMSAAGRNSKWSNAAIVVEIRPEDIPQKYMAEAEKAGCPQLAGLFFRREIERLAYENGRGQAAPAQLLTDFLAGRKSEELPSSSYTPGLVSSELGSWLPSHICSRLKKGFVEIDRNIHGFVCNEALLIAAETRTSTPVRILREKDSYECTAIEGLYPAGEGSGYSGGIVSSAMDGENVCSHIAEQLLKKKKQAFI